jgi:hypothetical protein
MFERKEFAFDWTSDDAKRGIYLFLENIAGEFDEIDDGYQIKICRH